MTTIKIPITLDVGPAREQIAALGAALAASMSPAAEPSTPEAPAPVAKLDIETVTAALDKLHETTAELRQIVGGPRPDAPSVVDTLDGLVRAAVRIENRISNQNWSAGAFAERLDRIEALLTALLNQVTRAVNAAERANDRDRAR